MKTLVVESADDKLIIERLLEDIPRPLRRYRVLDGDGQSGSLALARTVLATTSDRVAVALDADSTDSEKVQSKRSELLSWLSSFASAGRCQVFLFSPSIDALFFEPAISRMLFPRARAETAPWAFLDHKRLFRERVLRSKTLLQFLDDLSEPVLSGLRADAVVAQIREFLRGR